MVRHWTRLGLVLAVAACLVPPSSALGRDLPTVDEDTKKQLTAAASTLVQNRSQALVQRSRERPESVPDEILGVVISPKVAKVQERAVRELENRNRAPIEGGPPYTGARTRLEPARAVRSGDHITLEAIEHTEVRYRTGKVIQSIRRRFDFTTQGERITLTGERVIDPKATPVNDPAPSR
ncbi:hypothetical protein [Actinomadura sp. 9N407]|uniref:hypothetical protein n=1 Tax=Actinomadura sp. 9N407 TaxID=3375154 RepID=UPI00379D8AF3